MILAYAASATSATNPALAPNMITRRSTLFFMEASLRAVVLAEARRSGCRNHR
jgi:hypothetical protein